MRGEVVIDASVAAKVFFTEDGSDRARALGTDGRRFAAPEFITLEIASVASKYARRSLIDADHGREAIRSIPDLIDDLEPVSSLAGRAFDLSILHGFSVHDATYLALAEALGSVVITADEKLAARAREAGLGALIENL